MKKRNLHPEDTQTPDEGALRYLLTAYLFDNISKDGKQEVEEHLEGSAESRAELAELRRTLESVEDALGDEDEESETYSFEARRLERVLATGQARPWYSSGGFRACVAALALFAVGWMLIPSLHMSRLDYSSSTSRPGVGIRNSSQASPLSVEQDGRRRAWSPSGRFASGASGAAERAAIDEYRVLGEDAKGTLSITDTRESSVFGLDLAKNTAARRQDEAQTEVDQLSTEAFGRVAGQKKEQLLGRRVTRARQKGAPAKPTGKASSDVETTASSAVPTKTLQGALPSDAPVTWGFGADDSDGVSEAIVLSSNGALLKSPLLKSPLPKSTVPKSAATPLGTFAPNRFGQPARKVTNETGTEWFDNDSKVTAPEGARPPAAAPAPAPNSRRGRGRKSDESAAKDNVVLGELAQEATSDVGFALGFDVQSGPSVRDVAAPDGVLHHGVDEEENDEQEEESVKLFIRRDNNLGDRSSPAAEHKAKRAAEPNLSVPGEDGATSPFADRIVLFGDRTEERALREQLKTRHSRPRFIRPDPTGPTLEFIPSAGGITGAGLGIAGNSHAVQVQGSTTTDAPATDGDLPALRVENEPLRGEPDAVQVSGLERQVRRAHRRGAQKQASDVADRLAERGQLQTQLGEQQLLRPDLQALTPVDSNVDASSDVSLYYRNLELLAKAPAQQAPGVVDRFEKQARAYHYFQQLDQNVTLDQVSRLEVPTPAIGDEGLGQEAFRERYGVNPFVQAAIDNQSTFAMDVDTASFTRARSTLEGGKLPETESVRVEEFVNYFRQDYPAAPDTVFSVFSEGGPSPFGTGVELVKVTVKARELRAGERKDSILTLCIDTSGSMFIDRRLQLVKRALATLLDGLGPEDRVAIVAYNAQAYLAIPHTSAREKERLLGAIDSLAPGGASNVEAGLELAYRVADDVFQPRALNRVMLLSDGVATVGARGPEKILEKVKVYARRGVFLSSVGFGKRRYNDAMMERLSNEGNGRYDFVSDVKEARRIFAQNLPATLQVLAQDAKIQVEFEPSVVASYRLLGYENRAIQDHQFRDDKVDAGEVGPGTTVTALYEIERHPNAHGALGRIFVRYRDTGTDRVDELNFPLAASALKPNLDATSDLFRFIACAAETAELLRDSYWARDGSYSKVLKTLDGLSPPFRGTPQWDELYGVARKALQLTIPRLIQSPPQEK